MDEPIKIYTFLDFKDYLECYVANLKKTDPKVSHRYIAQIVGSSSVGWFGDILKSRRKLQGDNLSRLLAWMDLDLPEEEYFDLLVRFNQSETMVEKNRLYRHILSKATLDVDELEKESFQYFSEWHHSVIREYISTYGFDGDYQNLHQKIIPQLDMATLKESIHLLKDLKLIHKKANNHFEVSHAHLKKKKSSNHSLTFRNYIRTLTLIGLEQLDCIPKEERDYSALTISLDPAQFENIQAEVKALRNKIKIISEASTSNSRVYQCLFHVFPNSL